jgi:hypothetical protein
VSADAIDQSWGYLDPATAQRLGIKVVADYLSNDPSKNWTVAQIKAYHSHGIGVLLNWESEAGRPLLGAAAGQQDATTAVALARSLIAQVGYAPRSQIAIVYSTDRDTTPAQYPAIDAYYSATRATHAGRFLNGAYGEADLIEHLHAAGLTTVEWQTLAWSGGRISPEADLYQYQIDSTLGGSSVDLNQIRNASHLGAWWPPGHPLDTAETELGGGVPITIPATDWFDTVDQATLQSMLDAQTRTLRDGDAQHPNNLTVIRQILIDLTAAVAYAIRGDLDPATGKPSAKGSDTHPWNLKNGFTDDQSQLAALARVEAALTALQGALATPPTAGGITAEQVAQVVQAAHDGASSASVVGRPITLTGSIA